jgi:aminoglycoside phosphotransferase (APT) family kinase protein
MKDSWERIELSPSLDIRQINEIINPTFSNKRVIASERIGVGLSNSNYKIHLEGSSEPFALRLYRGNKTIVDKEIDIAQLVRKSVPIAAFIYADTSCSTFEKPWAILEWKEGVHLWNLLKMGTLADITSAASSTGKVLADIHAYAFRESGFFGDHLTITDPLKMDGQRFLSVIEDCLNAQCGAWLGEQLTQKVWSFCQSYSSLLSESRETPVLLHSDFNGLNILMQHKSTGFSVSAVLDWEDAFSWSRYADIGNMLRYEENGSTFEKQFIRAYKEEGGVLNDNWKLLSKLEDLVALCDMLNTSTMNTPKRMRDLKNLITRTIQFDP